MLTILEFFLLQTEYFPSAWTIDIKEYRLLKGTLFASLVLPMAAATKKEKKRKEEAYPWKVGTSSGHISTLSNLFWTFDIYGLD
jgi:hypothetical protein